MVEIFTDRIEITNPGSPLVDTKRFVDTPPKSRNEALASLLRRIGICEERGSGWDKVVFQTELFQLPAPLAEAGMEYDSYLIASHIMNMKPNHDSIRINELSAVIILDGYLMEGVI